MSSSSGNPSRKQPWYRQMMAKLSNENTIKMESLSKEKGVDRRKQKKEDQVYGS